MSARVRLVLSVLLLLAGALLATRIRVTTDLLDALPRDGEIGRASVDARRFSLLDVVLVDVDGTSAPDRLHATIDDLGDRLAERTDLWDLRFRVDAADGLALRAAAMPHLVTLLDEDLLRARTTPEGLQGAMEGAQARLAGLTGSLMARLLPEDPLDLAGSVLTAIRDQGLSSEVRLVNGHFLDSTGTHGLLLLRARSSALATTRDSPFVQALEAELASTALPAEWIGSPRLAAEARATIESETRLAITAGSLLVAAVFLAFFRSLRPLLGAIPALLLGAAGAAAAAALRSPIHGIVLAFGGALAGLGVDYWIHLYLHGVGAGVPATFGARFALAARGFRELLGAYRISIAATLTSFLMLASSGYPAVADLAWIGVGSAVGAFLSVALAGPVVFALVARPGDRVPAVPVPDRVAPWIAVAAIVVVAGFAVSAVGVRFDGDPRTMDAREPATARVKEELEIRWGGGGTAALVVADGDSLDAALEALHPAIAALATAPGVSVQAPLTLLPPPSLRAARVASIGAPEAIDGEFLIAAEAAGFHGEALLTGLRATLAATAPPTLETWNDTFAGDLLDRTVRVEADGSAAVAGIVRGITQEALDHAAYEVALSGADARFVNPARLAEEGADRIRNELVTRSGLALVLVLAYLAARFRDPVRVLAAAMPSLAALGGTLGALAWFDIPLTPASGPALVLVIGLAFDQGIFLVEGEGGSRERFLASRAAIVIALANAFAGFAGLLTATHPAVRSVGIVVSVGIAFAALGAFAITPALLTATGNATSRRWMVRIVVVVALALALDQGLALAGRRTPPVVTLDSTLALEVLSPTSRRFGASESARSHGIWVTRLRGDAVAIGQAHAELAGSVRERIEVHMAAMFRDKVPSAAVRYVLIRGLPFLGRAVEADTPPAYLEELAAYTQIGPDPWARVVTPYTRKLFMHALHDVGQAMVDTPFLGCTGFLASGSSTVDGHTILARNWDFDGGSPFDEDKAVIAVDRDGTIPFLHVLMPGLAGVVSGVNAEGIGIALQAAASDAPIRPGAPMIFIAREILETARSLDDVQRVLETRRGFVSEAVLAVDGGTGEIAIFEVTPADVTRIPGLGTLSQANHLRGAHAQDATNLQRMAHGTTVPRLARMDALLAEGALSLPRAISILRDRGGLPDGSETAINADIASHGVVIDATDRSLTVSAWPNVAGAFVQFRLDDVLRGNLQGEVIAAPDDPTRTLRVHEARRLAALAEDARPAVAISLADQALRFSPDFSEALLVRAEARIALGDGVAALEDLGRIPDGVPRLLRDRRDALRAEAR